MSEWLQLLGQRALYSLARLGRGQIFFLAVASALGGLWRRPGLVIAQLHVLGVLSLPIILVAGLFVWMRLFILYPPINNLAISQLNIISLRIAISF